MAPTAFQTDEAFPQRLDAEDPLRTYRERFHLPIDRDGRPLVYFAGNSLGLMPRTARTLVDQELDDWARFAVDSHFKEKTPWYSYHEMFRESGARLVGGHAGEVVMMNSLTVNLHLMMVSFYRPTKKRYKIIMDAPGFPSDTYAVKSQIAAHRFDPNDALVWVRPGEGENSIHPGDIESILEDHGDQVALVLLSGVNFFTGQVFDIAGITALAQREGCTVGLDLAHGVGNIPLDLHDWGVDFAVWCNYKYVNAGPGAIGGCFVHEKHGKNTDLLRLAGWWGNDPVTRFQMQLLPDFVPAAGAEGWQVSNPPIFSAVPLRASLDIFDDAGIPALRSKSQKLTGYLQFLLDQIPSGRYEVITPKVPAARGCQLSIRVNDRPKELFAELEEAGVKGDFREPDVVRVAPVPLYNTFHEVWRFAQVLAKHA
ncbi:MAG TPA: kynureninase [Phycisphaerae bacterium]|nr:kynureninase [Phycisphaerae bacterium]